MNRVAAPNDPKANDPKARWRSECPIASSLDIVGDKWTLLVLRDLLDGKTRFKEFEASPESIPTNILTERLRRLVDHGRPVLLAMADWGNAYIADTWVPPDDYLT